MNDRYREKLPEKSYAVAPGDVVGGLIFIMDKPLGIEEGMVGISIDSEPYRQFVEELVTAMEYKITNEASTNEIINNLIKMIPDDHPLYRAYQMYRQRHPEVVNFRSVPVDQKKSIIDALLKDSRHKVKRPPLTRRDLRKLFGFRRLHEVKVFQKEYRNKGMGGLLFDYYMQTFQIKPNDHFATKIGKLINAGNKAYMVKQDGPLVLGGMAPSNQKLLKASIGTTWLQPLLNPLVILATAGLSIPLFGLGYAGLRGFYIARNRPNHSNSEAIVEALSTNLASLRGFEAQEIDTIEGTYADGTPKIATIVTWKKGCRDLSEKLAGGEATSDSVIVMSDKHGLPIKIDINGNIIEVKDVDENKKPISYQKVLQDGTIQDATEEEYTNGMMLSEDKIRGLGESLLSFISMGDRDGIGRFGQNKAIIPLHPHQNGFTHQFYGIDFGKAYNGPNPVINSLRDDFSFDNPIPSQQRFRNISILYDTPLHDKMKGVYLLSALKGELTNPIKERIAKEYEDRGDHYFATKLRDYPASTHDIIQKKYELLRNELREGEDLNLNKRLVELAIDTGINSDIALIELELAKYRLLESRAPEGIAKQQYGDYIRRIESVKNISEQTDAQVLSLFEKRKSLTPTQIDILDNMEKLTAKQAFTTSLDGKVRLNHIRVDKADRTPWQFERNTDDTLTLICEAPQNEQADIRNRLNNIQGPQELKDLLAPMTRANAPLRLSLTPENLQLLNKQLTEERVANARGLNYRTPSEKTHVYQVQTAKRKEDSQGALRVKIQKPETTPNITPSFSSTNESEKRKFVGFSFSSVPHAEISSPRAKTGLSQTQLNTNQINAYLTTENKTKHHIIKSKPLMMNGIQTGLEMTFHNASTNQNPKVYADNLSHDNEVSFSAHRMAQDDFVFVANEIAKIAVAVALPGAEFDLSAAPDDKRAILENAFTQAIEEAIRENPNRFTDENKPKIYTPSVTVFSPR